MDEHRTLQNFIAFCRAHGVLEYRDDERGILLRFDDNLPVPPMPPLLESTPSDPRVDAAQMELFGIGEDD
jgi:hypothetical protein